MLEEKKDIKVSVIVPVYGVEKYIERCIKSFLSQSLEDWELILVDDCGPDNSMKIVRDYAKLDGRIKYIEGDSNQGPMIAREKGCIEAHGEYVTFCDGDDTLPDKSLQLFYETAKRDNVDVVIGQFASIHYNGEVSQFPIKASLPYGNNAVGVLKSILNYKMPQGLCGKFFKREIVKNHPKVIKKATMGEDAGVLFQYIEKIQSAVVLEEVVYNYYQNSSSSTHKIIPAESLEGLCKLAVIRESVVCNYKDLIFDFNRYIINNFISLYPVYKKNGVLDYYLKENGLSHYLKRRNIVKHYGLIKSLKYLLLRDVIPVAYPIYKRIKSI